MKVAADWFRLMDREIVKRFLLGSSKTMVILAMTVLVILMTITLVDVVCRHTFLRPPWGAGGFEVTEILMTQLASLALVACWYAGGHIRVHCRQEGAVPKEESLLLSGTPAAAQVRHPRGEARARGRLRGRIRAEGAEAVLRPRDRLQPQDDPARQGGDTGGAAGQRPVP